jgi:replicative DNA helicase
MGKSLMLAQLAVTYAKQNLKVLYFTLEDPISEVEDRLDASLANIPIEKLHLLPNKLKKRFKKFSVKISNRIRIVDCTDEGISVDGIEDEWEKHRDQGFDADVIIIDYDDEIIPPRQYKDSSGRRMEFHDIYKALRQLAARRNVIVWTAAQTKRLPEKTKIISGDKLAEDISKIRKATLAIGIGQGETHADARYIYVAGHKRGRSKFGFEIMIRPHYGMFFDRDRTAKLIWSKKKVV